FTPGHTPAASYVHTLSLHDALPIFNQINNVLAFPGIFRGLLDARAPRVDDDAKIAAARGIASLVTDEELAAGRVVPSPFDPAVAPTVAAAVREHLGA